MRHPDGTGLRRGGTGHAARLTEALDPWGSGRRYQNFTERPLEPGSFFYEPETQRRLAAIKARVDPDGLFQANHAIDPHLVDRRRYG